MYLCLALHVLALKQLIIFPNYNFNFLAMYISLTTVKNMPYMEVKDRVTELFPCLRSTVFAFAKLAPNGLFATMSPEPPTAWHIKNWIFPATASSKRSPFKNLDHSTGEPVTTETQHLDKYNIMLKNIRLHKTTHLPKLLFLQVTFSVQDI